MSASQRSFSFWHEGVEVPVLPPLRGSVTTDVCVIGAGIAGLSTAWLLARDGLSVAVVEALDLAAGETSRSTAHIAVPDDRYWIIERDHGAKVARDVADSFAASIDTIESIVRDADIACDFQRLDGLLVSCAEEPREALERELAAARRAGVAVEWLEQAPGAYAQFGACLRFERQAQFNPFRYLLGLATSLPRRTALFCGTRALTIEERGDGVIVRTDGGTVNAAAAVVATNTPFNERFGLHLRQSAYQTYVVAGVVPKGELPRTLLWDDGDPYHYVRLAPHDERHDVLIVGGADHKTGQESDAPSVFEDLDTWVHRHLPCMESIRWRWTGEIMEPLDSLANLGREPGSERTYLITGDSGNGITHATLGAMIVSNLIQQKPARWADTYDPARSRTHHAKEFAREQANIAAQYRDWLTSGDAPNVGEIGFDSGAVVRQGMRKIAVYRDAYGDVFANSAVCPHLGCIVQWNGAEKTWDCPCHGSRFNAYGAVLHGPANRALASMNQPRRLQSLITDAEEDGSARGR